MLKILLIQSHRLHLGFLQPEIQDVLLQPKANCGEAPVSQQKAAQHRHQAAES